MPPSVLRVHLALITVSLVFGANYVFTKHILATVSPAAWVLFRVGAATVVLVPLALAMRRRSMAWPHARLVLGLVVASFFGVVLNQVLFTEGIARTTPEHSAVINAGIPTWTLLVAVCVGQERLGWRRVLAVVLALAGVLYLLLGAAAVTTPGERSPSLLGDVLTVTNGLSFAVHLVLMRRLGRTIDPWLATAVMFVAASLMVGAWSGPRMQAGDVDAVLTVPVVWMAVYAVLLATVMTYALNTWALRHTHSSQVALYINLQPLVAAALNAAMGAPLPGHRFFVALVLVSLGLWLQTRVRSA
ncbi:MAG TPA: DMT family transporter [Planctomycetota bacterium]|nr:DMT family transporter [Planctomycetota bacterium]